MYSLEYLQRDFERDAFGFARDVKHLGMNRIAGSVEMLDEFDNSIFVLKGLAIAGARIGEGDFHATIQITPVLVAASLKWN